MCGRFVSASPADEIAKYFDAAMSMEALAPSHNVAPTSDIYAVVTHADGTRHLEVFRWGLVPVWAKDLKISQKMINARSETLTEKGAYKPAFTKGRRVLIPMDGFYEWKTLTDRVTAKGKPAKQPMYVQRLDGEPLAVAGLWEAWREGQWPRRTVAALGDDHHDGGERNHGADTRPHAGDPAGIGMERLARPRQRRPRIAREAHGAGTGESPHPAPGLHRGEQGRQPRPGTDQAGRPRRRPTWVPRRAEARLTVPPPPRSRLWHRFPHITRRTVPQVVRAASPD